MRRKRFIFFLFGFFFASQCWGADLTCLRKSSIPGAFELGKQSCEIHRKLCDGIFASEQSDLAQYLKKCPEENSDHSYVDHASQCLALMFDPLVDSTFQFIYSAQKTAQENLDSTKQLINECVENKETRDYMINLVPLLNSSRTLKTDQTTCSYIVTEFQAWTLDYATKHTEVRRAFEKDKSAQKISTEKGTSDQILNTIWNQQSEKFACLNNYGKTYLSCYYFFSVVDPTLLASLTLKAPQLAKFFKLESALGKYTLGKSPILAGINLRKIGGRYNAMLGNYWEVGRLKSHLGDEGTHLIVDLYSVDPAFRKKGISEVLLAEAVKDNPKLTRISGLLAMTNKEEYIKALKEGLTPSQAYARTPLGKAAAKLGFTKVEIVSELRNLNEIVDVTFVKP